MNITHSQISPYLQCPAIAPTLYQRRQRHSSLVRFSPIQLTLKSMTGLALWGVLIISAAGINAHGQSLPGQNQAASVSHNQFVLPSVAGSKMSTAVGASVLPGGPSGQLLPPGTMAEQGTYHNSYVAGQCTWYVAGRRPVPSNWGNARTWLSGAQRAGFATGKTPALAAIAWTPAGWFGHVALVKDIKGDRVLVTEMNYTGAYHVDERWVAASNFEYIY